LVLKITISNVVSEKPKLDDRDYVGQIVSEIQTKVYYNNVIVIANKFANKCSNSVQVPRFI